MADVTDVQNVLVGLISAWIYPNGSANPSALGFPVHVSSGWPVMANINQDLAVGIADITIYGTDFETNTTRYVERWQTQTPVTPTLTLSASGRTITVGGTLPVPYVQQNLAVFVNDVPYTYAAQSTDTPTTIATALATLIAAAVPGTSSAGQLITLPAGALLGALRVGGSGSTIKEIRRQNRLFNIGMWASTAAQRTAIANLIDPLLADLRGISMPDGFTARIVYRNSPQRDLSDKTPIFQRDLCYWIEFATTKTQNTAQVVVGKFNVRDANGNLLSTAST